MAGGCIVELQPGSTGSSGPDRHPPKKDPENLGRGNAGNAWKAAAHACKGHEGFDTIGILDKQRAAKSFKAIQHVWSVESPMSDSRTADCSHYAAASLVFGEANIIYMHWDVTLARLCLKNCV
jgi:hypothetical protein